MSRRTISTRWPWLVVGGVAMLLGAALLARRVPRSSAPGAAAAARAVERDASPSAPQSRPDTDSSEHRAATSPVESDAPAPEHDAAGTLRITSALGVPLRLVRVQAEGATDWETVHATGGEVLIRGGRDVVIAAPGHRIARCDSAQAACTLEPHASLHLGLGASARELVRELRFMDVLSSDAGALAWLDGVHTLGPTDHGFGVAIDASAFQQRIGEQAHVTLSLLLASATRLDVRWRPASGQHASYELDARWLEPVERAPLEVAVRFPADAAASSEALVYSLHALARFDVSTGSFAPLSAEVLELEWGELALYPAAQFGPRLARAGPRATFDDVAIGRAYCVTVRDDASTVHGRAVFQFDGAPVEVSLARVPRVKGRVEAPADAASLALASARIRIEYGGGDELGGSFAWNVEHDVRLDGEGAFEVPAAADVPANPLVEFPPPSRGGLSIEVAGYAPWETSAAWSGDAVLDLGVVRLQRRAPDVALLVEPAHLDTSWFAVLAPGASKETLVRSARVIDGRVELELEAPLADLDARALLAVRSWGNDMVGFERAPSAREWRATPQGEYVVHLRIDEALADGASVEIGWSWRGIDCPLARLDAGDLVDDAREPATFRAPTDGVRLWRVFVDADGERSERKTFDLQPGRSVAYF